MDSLRVLYLTRNLAINGRDAFAGREVVGQLRSDGWTVELRHQASLEEHIASADPRIRSDLITLEEVENFAPDCIFSEGGLLAAGGAQLRIPADWLRGYVHRGGVLIVEGLDQGELQSAGRGSGKDEQDEMLRLLLSDGSRPGPFSMPYIRDEYSNDGHSASVVCRPSEMVVSDWLCPVYEGIDRLVVGSPVPLAFSGELLATTEISARVLTMDRYEDSAGPYLWAKVLPDGVGYIAVLTGSIVHDHWVETNPDNARWIQNVIVHLVDASRREAFLRGITPTRPNTSGRPVTSLESPVANQVSTSQLALQPEDHRLEFKETARINTRTGLRDDAIELSVVKTVAAFANSDGGVLLIGVDDGNRVVGIGPDFKTLGKRQNEDGFGNWLTVKLHDFLGPVAASGARIAFENIDGLIVCRVDVDRAPSAVYVKGADFYIRSNNTTQSLGMAQAHEYIRAKWST
jgi:hypothetical protein